MGIKTTGLLARDASVHRPPPPAFEYSLRRRAFAEILGTFVLVLGGCGSAVLSTHGPGSIGMAGVSVAFGLTVFTMATILGPISGCHLNPAVTLGAWSAGKFETRDLPVYVAAQVAGAIAAAVLLLLIAQGVPGYVLATNGLAQNGYGAGSPEGASLLSAAITETLLTCAFVLVILGATAPRASKYLAPLAIGGALTLVHLISIPITNTSVNPARSTGPALLVGGLAVRQLWLFWLAPLAGALLAGALSRSLFDFTDSAGDGHDSPIREP